VACAGQNRHETRSAAQAPRCEEGCQAGMQEETGTKSVGDKKGTFAACRYGLPICKLAHKAARPKMGSASQFGKAGTLS